MPRTTYKLLALDVDGTLLNGRHRIAAETRAALSRAMAAGLHVTLATGRAFPSARAIALSLGLHTPLVTHDGAYVADPVTGEVLHADRVPVDLVREAVAAIAPLGVNISLLHEQFAVSNERIRNFRWQRLMPGNWHSLANMLMENRVYRNRYAPDLLAYLKERPVSPPKLWVTGPASAVAEARRRLESLRDGALRCPSAGPEATEVMLRQTSKAGGLRRLAKALGIDFSQVIAVGDSYNDVEMIREAGLGVAMGNAPADVQGLARYVTRPNTEHGVAHVVEKFVLAPGA